MKTYKLAEYSKFRDKVEIFVCENILHLGSGIKKMFIVIGVNLP